MIRGLRKWDIVSITLLSSGGEKVSKIKFDELKRLAGDLIRAFLLVFGTIFLFFLVLAFMMAC